MTKRSPVCGGKCNQLRKSRSWVIHWVRTASTDLRPGVACRRTGMADFAHELPGAGERDYIDLDDEEGILRAAAQIRQRRVAERLKEIQERRQQSRPVRIKKRGGPVLHGDCLDLIPTLEDESVSLVVTSPPYAEQRAGHYEGIPEEDYPDFTVQWMTALAPKMTPMAPCSW